MSQLYEQAKAHVEDTPELAPYVDIILYDWTEGDEHLEWVLSAPVGEVVDWAERIRRDEEHQQSEEEAT